MGMFGFLKKKSETIQLPPEEPEFLRKVDLSASGAAQGVKAQVEPELALWLSNGTTATGLKELASALRKMKASDYKEHVNPERNDIAEWVQEILNDFELARKLRRAKGKIQAAKAIEKGIKALKAAKRAAAAQTLKKKTGKKSEPKLSELPEIGYELQNIPLPDIPAEKPQMADTKKGRLFSRLFGKKPKEEGDEQPLESLPILPEMPELTEEPKAAKAMKITKKLSKKAARIAARKAEKEMKELLPQLPKSEEALETSGENFETPIEMPRIEDFQNYEPAEPLTEEAPKTKKEGKGILGFLFKRKETETKKEREKQKTEPAEAATEIDAAIAAAGAPSTPAPAKSLPAPEFEPEPHHAKWEELPTAAELPDNELNEQPELVIPAAAVRRRSRSEKRARPHEEYDDLETIRQDHELERTEKELTRQEEELNNKRLELTRKRYELIKQKGELESKKFEEFIRKHKNRNEKEEALVRDEIYSQESTPATQGISIRGSEPTGRLQGMPDFRLSSAYGKERLDELLEEAKQHIRQNNMEEAQRALHEAQSVFDTVYMTNNEKKLIEYEILEVEADLKLASLK